MSQEAVRLLEKLGYTNVGHFEGGVREWRQADLPFDYGDERSVTPEAREESGADAHP